MFLFDDRLGDREAETGSFSDRFGGEERRIKFLFDLLRDSRAVVFDNQPYPVAVFCQSYLDGRTISKLESDAIEKSTFTNCFRCASSMLPIQFLSVLSRRTLFLSSPSAFMIFPPIISQEKASCCSGPELWLLHHLIIVHMLKQ